MIDRGCLVSLDDHAPSAGGIQPGHNYPHVIGRQETVQGLPDAYL
jgi:hypothetical protein